MESSQGILLVGLELRYVLTRYLFDVRSMTVRSLVQALERDGFRVGGRPSKTVSDALRAEVEPVHGRSVARPAPAGVIAAMRRSRR